MRKQLAQYIQRLRQIGHRRMHNRYLLDYWADMFELDYEGIWSSRCFLTCYVIAIAKFEGGIFKYPRLIVGFAGLWAIRLMVFSHAFMPVLKYHPPTPDLAAPFLITVAALQTLLEPMAQVVPLLLLLSISMAYVILFGPSMHLHQYTLKTYHGFLLNLLIKTLLDALWLTLWLIVADQLLDWLWRGTGTTGLTIGLIVTLLFAYLLRRVTWLN